MKKLLLALTLVALANADVRLPALISDHMVLQRGIPVRIWGWASPGEAVTVSYRGQTSSATADSAGKWEVFLKPLSDGAAADLTVSGKNTIVVHDVLTGEVWVASGQSNMEFALKNAVNADDEIARASYPKIRLFLVKKNPAEKPVEDVEGSWMPVSPEAVKPHSAVSYFFAREIHQTQHVPVGIINSYWGGTTAQAWTSRPTLEADASMKSILDDWQKVLDQYPAAKVKFDEALEQWKKTRQGNQPRPPNGPGSPAAPSTLYDGMIAPITPYAIRGAIWYQGESNASEAHAYLYRRLFSDMIQDWRRNWGLGQFPFLFVQLANFESKGWWPLLRESQTETLGLHNTGMAVITDVGNPKDIHPKDKQTVGHRLALPARAMVYGEKIEFSGPMFREMTTEGSKARIWFDHIGSGLAVRGNGPLAGFEIAGSDGNFVPADATIEGQTVVVSSASVTRPAKVRYAWQDNPESANLINMENLPASPFRNRPSGEK